MRNEERGGKGRENKDMGKRGVKRKREREREKIRKRRRPGKM